jgi:hypothetical protein
VIVGVVGALPHSSQRTGAGSRKGVQFGGSTVAGAAAGAFDSSDQAPAAVLLSPTSPCTPQQEAADGEPACAPPPGGPCSDSVSGRTTARPRTADARAGGSGGSRQRASSAVLQRVSQEQSDVETSGKTSGNVPFLLPRFRWAAARSVHGRVVCPEARACLAA